MDTDTRESTVYGLVPDGTHAVRRRQRREGLRVVAGAVAVALVAVGGSAAVSVATAEEPAPERPEAAAPSTPTESSEGAAEELRGPLNLVRSGMSWWEEDRSVPDPSVARGCPDAADALGESFFGGYDVEPTAINAAGSTLTGCGWSSDLTATDTADWRVDVALRAEADVSGDTVLRRLDAITERDSCAWAPLFDGDPVSALTICEDVDQRTWTVTIADDDGTGAWTLTTAVGADLSAAFETGGRYTATLWEVVAELPATEQDPEKTIGHEDGPGATSREFVEVVEALRARPDPLGLATTGDWACSGVTAALSSTLGVDLAEGQVSGSDPPDPLCWWTAGTLPASDAELGRTLGLGLQFLPDLDDAVHRELSDPGLQQLMGPEGPVYPDTCLRAEPFTTRVRTTVLACSAGGSTHWRVISGDVDDSGLWGLSVYVPADADVDQSAAVLALVDEADRLW